MNLSTIQSQVRFLTKEPFPTAPQFATNSNILLWANYATQELQSRTKCYTSSNVPNSTGQPPLNTVSGQRLYAFPSDCLELLAVKVSVWTLERKTLDWLNQFTGYQWWTYPGIPLFYWIEKNSINSFGIWYTPTAVYPIALWYIRKPTDMVNSGDSPDIDPRLHQAVIYYCCEKAMEGRREMNFKAGYWNGLYEKEIQKWNTTADQSVGPVEFLGSTPVSSD